MWIKLIGEGSIDFTPTQTAPLFEHRGYYGSTPGSIRDKSDWEDLVFDCNSSDIFFNTRTLAFYYDEGVHDMEHSYPTLDDVPEYTISEFNDIIATVVAGG